MTEAINRWIENIAVYSVLLVLVLHMLPSGEMKKYVRFFLGLLFVLVVFEPILRWSGQTERLSEAFAPYAMEHDLQEFKEKQERLQRELQQYEEESNEGEESGDERLVEPVEIRIGREEAAP